MNLYNNIKVLRKINNLSQSQLGERVGYERSSIAKIENGGVDLPQSKIQAFANVFGISPSQLMSDDFSGKENITKINSVMQIPLYSSISCGTGIFVDDSIEDYITVPERYLKKGTEYFANIAAGDSMIGKGIKNGDILVFEKTNVLENGQIGSFCIGESEAVCKTLRKLQNGMIMLESANDAYDPIVVDLSSECFRVIGKYKFKFSIEQ